MSLKIENASKLFDDILFENLDLEVEKGEIVALLGNSGCGKSTLLRIICGLENLDDGEIYLHDKNITQIHPSKRKIGMIFQKPVLYPHLSVEKNIQLGLPKSTTKTDGKKQIEEILATVQLEGFEKRKVDELSGGEKQRISFARAMLSKPEALMMDEPFSALDNEIRNELCDWTRKFLKEMEIPVIHVTHDENEATRIADRVIRFDKL